MTSQPGKETNAIHIAQYLNHTMKFGQLIEYNVWSIFHEKSYTKCSEETFPRPFS